jgi:acetyl-CoA C-acetyltransferase
MTHSIPSTRRRVGVVSSAQTDWRSAWSGAQHIDLISAAVQQALEGSGLRIEDVEFVIDSGSDVLDGRSISNCGFLGAMGAHHKEESGRGRRPWARSRRHQDRQRRGDVGLIIAYAKPSKPTSAFHSTIADPFCQRPVRL